MATFSNGIKIKAFQNINGSNTNANVYTVSADCFALVWVGIASGATLVWTLDGSVIGVNSTAGEGSKLVLATGGAIFATAGTGSYDLMAVEFENFA